MRIAVVGAGGVGGYFGARLASAGLDVHLLARGDHLRAVRARGLRVRSVLGDVHVEPPAHEEAAEVGPCDAVLFTVKSYDTEAAARRLPPLLRAGTAVVSLQNGIDNEERIEALVGPGHVMGGAAFVFARIAEPGVIEHSGGPSSLVFGELDGSRSARGERLLAACVRAGIPAELVPDIRARLWDKFAFICAQAGMTAATRLPIGAVRADPEAAAMFRRIVEEVVALAGAEGVVLPAGTVDGIVAFAGGLEPESRSSLHDDLAHGRSAELEALHGEVVRRARARRLPAPMCEAVYALLRPAARLS